MFNINKGLATREFNCKQCEILLLVYGSFSLANPDYKELRTIGKHVFRDQVKYYELRALTNNGSFVFFGYDVECKCNRCGIPNNFTSRASGI